jgi:hypothetical protein
MECNFAEKTVHTLIFSPEGSWRMYLSVLSQPSWIVQGSSIFLPRQAAMAKKASWLPAGTKKVIFNRCPFQLDILSNMGQVPIQRPKTKPWGRPTLVRRQPQRVPTVWGYLIKGSLRIEMFLGMEMDARNDRSWMSPTYVRQEKLLLEKLT